MASRFADAYAAFAAPLLDHELVDATPITWVADSGTSTRLYAQLGRVRVVEEEDAWQKKRKRSERTCRIRTDPACFYGGIRTVLLKDQVTIGSDTWSVLEIISSTETYHDVGLVLLPLMDQSRPKA